MDDDLRLADRTFHCAACGLIMDRDLNAAINLSKLAGSSSESQNACGEISSDRGHAVPVKLAPAKQEPSTLCASA